MTADRAPITAPAAAGEPTLRTGLIVGFLVTLSTLAAEALARDHLGLNFFVQLILALVICRRFVGDWLGALTLLTINDICMNGVSTFFEQMKLPAGRTYLYAATMGLFLLRSMAVSRPPTSSARPPMSSAQTTVLFYGLLLPALLIVYSILIRGTPAARAVGDMKFIAPILLYFPIRQLLKRNEGFFMGWMIALAIVLSLLALTISFAPLDLSSRIFDNLASEAEAGHLTEETIEEGFGTQRGCLITFILTFIGFFFGALQTVNFKQRLRRRVLGALLCVFCISHLFVDFLRGPLFGILGILLLTLFTAAIKRSTRWLAGRMVLLILALAAGGILFMASIVPEGLQRFTKDTDSVSDYVGEARRETGEAMQAAFQERPLLGQGVGMPPPAYLQLNGEGPLNFCWQYLLVLYRVGLLGFLLFMVPIVWLYRELMSPRGALDAPAVFSQRGQFRLALLLSVLTTTIAGITNPYLKTGYLMVVIASYWAYTHHLKEEVLARRQTLP